MGLCAQAPGQGTAPESAAQSTDSGQKLEFRPILDGARDATNEGQAFVELATDRTEFFVQQPIRLLLRFGIEDEFSRTQAVQPFGARLDVPVQVRAPWIEELPGALALGMVEQPLVEGETRSTFALNESVRRARHAESRVVGDREFRVYEIELSFLPTAEGELRFSAPTLAYAYATHFEEGFLQGRTPVDRVDAFVTGEPLAVAIRPLPEEGRPWEFTNAVGSFSVRARVEPLEISMGESLELELTIEGEGNLGTFDPPHWSDIGGFRVLGLRDEKDPAARRLVYELAPDRAELWQVPAISFAFFDPTPLAGYHVVRTDPVDVVVKAAAGSGVARDPAGNGGTGPLRDRDPPREQRERVGFASWVWVSGLVLLALAAFVLARRR